MDTKKFYILISVLFTLNNIVNAQLTVTVYQSSTTVCSDSSVILDALTSGGTAPYTYNWSTGETAQTIVVSPTTTRTCYLFPLVCSSPLMDFPNTVTTYTVTVSDATPSTATAQAIVTVSPKAVEQSSYQICKGDTFSIFCSPGNNFKWIDGNNYSSSDTIKIYPTISTSYTITVSENSCTNTQKISINVIDCKDSSLKSNTVNIATLIINYC